MPAALPILLVTLVVRLLPRGAPQKPALVAVCPAAALVTVGLADLAWNTVNFVDVRRAEFGPGKLVHDK